MPLSVRLKRRSTTPDGDVFQRLLVARLRPPLTDPNDGDGAGTYRKLLATAKRGRRRNRVCIR
jgi:hypothetical protein